MQYMTITKARLGEQNAFSSLPVFAVLSFCSPFFTFNEREQR